MSHVTQKVRRGCRIVFTRNQSDMNKKGVVTLKHSFLCLAVLSVMSCATNTSVKPSPLNRKQSKSVAEWR